MTSKQWHDYYFYLDKAKKQLSIYNKDKSDKGSFFVRNTIDEAVKAKNSGNEKRLLQALEALKGVF